MTFNEKHYGHNCAPARRDVRPARSKLSEHQQREARVRVRRCKASKRQSAKSYNIRHSTISRLTL